MRVAALDLEGFVIFSGDEAGVTVLPGRINAVGPIILSQVMNRKPRILPAIGNRAVMEGELLQFTVNAEDPDAAHHVACTASNLPQGAKFDPETQLFSWKPDYGDAGVYKVMFRVVDDGEPPMSDAETVIITVGHVNRPPIMRAVEKSQYPGGGDPDLRGGGIGSGYRRYPLLQRPRSSLRGCFQPLYPVVHLENRS